MQAALLNKLARLERSGLPPLTREAVKKLERDLGAKLPREAIALYLHHGGARKSLLPARLLPPRELLKTQRQLGAVEWNEKVEGTLLFLWEDGQSNHAAVYADGPARGKVCVIDHGEPSAAPRFPSVAAFYRALFVAHARADELVSLVRPARRATSAAPASPLVRRPVALDKHLLKRVVHDLEKTPWLARVGEPGGLKDRGFELRPKASAVASARSQAWGHVGEEAQAQLTVTLSKTNPDAYRHWDKIIGEARKFFSRTVAPALDGLEARAPGWGEVRDALLGDVFALVTARYYELAHGIPSGFTARLRKVHEAGRVAVGFRYPPRAGALQEALRLGTGTLLVG